MPQLNELWNTPKSWISAYNSRQTMHRQWRRASSTELENLTYNKINIDTSYQHHPYGDSDEAIIGEPAKRTTSNRDYTKGWRFGVLNCAVSASVVFLVNLVVTIWGSVYNKSSAPGILFDGDCGKAEQLNTGIHLLINGLSTILLSSSNYCMQCLSAPTRTEVNEAHAKGEWLDIGIPSVRNLRRIDRRRVYLWLLLGLSSLPLHLFYNSAVFSSIYSNSYNAFSVRQSFLDNPTCVGCNVTGLADMHANARNGSILEKMDPAKCLDEYAQMIQATRRNVLLVASDDKFPPGSSNFTLIDSSFGTMSFTASNILLQGYRSLNAYSWICSGVDAFRNTSPYEIFCKNGISAIKKTPENWRVGESCGFSYRNCTTPTFPVQYCLSEKAEPHCKLQFSLAIAILVTILNFFKAALMFYVAYSIVEDPLITMGDAVASFLEEEDATTKGMCLLTYRDIKKKSGYRVGPKEWQDTIWRWRDVASKTRWGVTLAMFALALIVVGSLLGVGINALPSTQSRSLPALAQIGFGAIGK